MTTTRLHQIGFASAILCAVSWAVYIVAQPATPDLTAVEAGRQYFRTIQENRLAFLLYGWSGVAGTLLLVGFLIPFRVALEAERPLVALGSASSLIGATLAVVGFSAPLMLAYHFLPAGLAAGPESVETVRVAAAIAADVVEVSWNLGSFLVFGLAVFVFALEAFRAGVGPAWVNATGMAGGIAGLVWFQAYAPFLLPIALPLILVNIVATLVWGIGLSAALLRRAGGSIRPARLEHA